MNRSIFLLFAGIILLASILMTGCGGGGSNPVAPPNNNPVVPPPPIPPGAVVTAFRLHLTDPQKSGGRSIYENMLYEQKIIDVYSNALELRFRLEGQVGGQWFLYTGLDTTRLDIRITGIESGEFAPEITILPPHEQAFSTSTVWWIEPNKGAGRINLVADVYGSSGVLCSLAFGLQLHGNDNGGGEPTCLELHPIPEAIGGYWWKCINGVWSNTGEPVNPPSGYTLHVFGAQGEFIEGGTINIDEANGYSLPNWELWGSDGFKVQLGSADVQFESSVLPFWCWDPVRGEINTAFWINPSNPNVNDPGNIFINPGQYDIQFSISYGGKDYCRSGKVNVTDRPDFP